ncbi:MAG: cytochrome c-type biogenesis protein CcmH [Acidimicrobiales bacterium]
MRRLRGPGFRRWSWLCIGALVLVALVRAGVSDGPARTNVERVRDVASTIKCPTCRSQSVAGSDSAAARAIRNEIARRVADGESADEIRAAVAANYGSEVLLTPSGSGIEGLVWVLPVIALVVGLAALSAAFARWRRTTALEVTDEDRALVAAALAARVDP